LRVIITFGIEKMKVMKKWIIILRKNIENIKQITRLLKNRINHSFLQEKIPYFLKKLNPHEFYHISDKDVRSYFSTVKTHQKILGILNRSSWLFSCSLLSFEGVTEKVTSSFLSKAF